MQGYMRVGFGLALCFAVAACGDKPAPVADAAPPPPPAEPAPPPPPMTGVDGVYGGTRTRTAESPKSCTRSGPATVRIVNGEVRYAPVRSQSFSAPVGGDGAFTATTGDSTFAGTVADGKITGTLDGSTCHYTLALSKSMSHGKHHMMHHRNHHHMMKKAS